VKASVLVVDDDAAVSTVLGALLSQAGHSFKHAASGEQALSLLKKFSPVVVVSDVRMPGLSGLDLQKEMARRSSPVPLILITGHGDIAMAVSAIKAGAHDFLEKPFDEQRLAEAIEAAVAEATSRRHTGQELADLSARHADLSERQRQVMDLAAKGRTNKEIGIELGISPRTVEIYRARVMERMGAQTLADLVRIAVQLGASGSR